MAEDKLRIGVCWDISVEVTHDNFTSGNLSGSTFALMLGGTELASIDEGDSEYSLSGTTVSLDYHIELATVANITGNRRYPLYVKWTYGSHVKEFDLNESEYIYEAH